MYDFGNKIGINHNEKSKEHDENVETSVWIIKF